MKKPTLLKTLTLALAMLAMATSGWGQYFVDFEGTGETNTSYVAATVNLSGLDWSIGPQALIGTLDNDKKFGDRSARMRRDGTTPGEMFMLEDKANGIGELSFYYARYGTETAQPSLTVQYSTNAGEDWIDIGTITSFPSDLTLYTATLNVEGNIRLRFVTDLSGTNQRRLNIDNITVTDFTGGTPTVATPTITPGTGNYFAPFDVTLATATEDATIYYSFDSGTGPWTAYNESAKPQVTTTSTIWAYAEKADMDDSAVASATYTFPVEVANIAAFRAGDNGTLYRITGEVVVLHRDSFRNRHFVRDATGSLTIWDEGSNITTEYLVADGVTGFVGVKAMKNSEGLVVLEAAANPGAATSSGLNVDPVTKTIAALTLDDTGNLVRIEDVGFDGTGTFATGQNYPITDASSKATINFRTDFFGADYIGQPIPENTGTITAIVGGFGAAPQVTARDAVDLDFTVEESITFFFRGPDWMNNDPHNPEIWGPFNGWSGPATMTFDAGLGWWSVEVSVPDASAAIEYQSRFSQDGATKYQKAFENFSANPTFTTTTGEIWIDASENSSFTWQGNDFYLAQGKITETQPFAPPTNHVTGFSAASNVTETSITLTWVDSDASNYLIKGHIDSFFDITYPVDGIPEADDNDLLVKNVTTGVGTHTFTGLAPGTTYYFKIWPYNGTGAAINYKTDGDVPQASATTLGAPLYYHTGFEDATKSAYASATVTLSGIQWNMTEALIGDIEADFKIGSSSARMRGYGASSITMLQDKPNGIGSISFKYRRYGTDPQVDWKVEYSTNGGVDWVQVGLVFTAPSTNVVQTFNEVVNIQGNVRIRIIRATEDGNTTNKRLNIDEIVITDYNTVGYIVDTSTAEGFSPDMYSIYISGSLFADEFGNWPEPGTEPATQMARLGGGYSFLLAVPVTGAKDVPEVHQHNYFVVGQGISGWNWPEWGGRPNRQITATPGRLVDDLFGYLNFVGNGNMGLEGWEAAENPISEMFDTYFLMQLNTLVKGNANIQYPTLEFQQNLRISPSGSVTVLEGNRLNVSGLITNLAGASGLILEPGSTLNHQAHNLDVQGTMKRNLKAASSWPGSNDGWNLVSSPVANQAINSSAWTPTATGYDFFAWEEGEVPFPWLNQKAPANAPLFNLGFIGAKGYLVAYQADGFDPPNLVQKTFSGVLNTGDVVYNLAYSANPGKWDYVPGWNLIGNPYPGVIEWDGLNYDYLLEDGFAYRWDSQNQTYDPEDNGLIYPNDGFFVLASYGGEFAFNNDVRFWGLKKSTPVQENLVLRLADDGPYGDVATFRQMANTSMDRDFRDALKVFSLNTNVPQLFSYTNDNVRVAVNTVPEIGQDVAFVIGIKAPTAGQYTISLEQADGVFQTQHLYLKDLTTGAVHDLNQTAEVSFAAQEGITQSRFKLLFTQPTSVEPVADNGTQVYVWNNQIMINFAENIENRALQVFDTGGRLVASHQLGSGMSHVLPVNLQTGVYIVRVTSPSGVFTQRVVVR